MRRLGMLLLVLALGVVALPTSSRDVSAETVEQEVLDEQDIELSELMTEDALVGYMEQSTWGVYLSEGVSVIRDAGSCYIAVGGITNAARSCEVSVNVIVERKTSSGSWARVASWSTTEEYACTAALTKVIQVTSGYYYRVRSNHVANTDTGYSFTDALWIEY